MMLDLEKVVTVNTDRLLTRYEVLCLVLFMG